MGRERHVAGVGVDGRVDDVCNVYAAVDDERVAESVDEAGDVC